jgi:hypothetical protein
LRTLLRAVTPLRITYAVMERYTDLRLQLRPQGSLIGDFDTLIAATALEQFYSTWFARESDSQEMAINPEQVWRLRADVRALLGRSNLQALGVWLVRQPVDVRLVRDGADVSRLRYAPGNTGACDLWVLFSPWWWKQLRSRHGRD